MSDPKHVGFDIHHPVKAVLLFVSGVLAAALIGGMYFLPQARYEGYEAGYAGLNKPDSPSWGILGDAGGWLSNVAPLIIIFLCLGIGTAMIAHRFVSINTNTMMAALGAAIILVTLYLGWSHLIALGPWLLLILVMVVIVLLVSRRRNKKAKAKSSTPAVSTVVTP